MNHPDAKVIAMIDELGPSACQILLGYDDGDSNLDGLRKDVREAYLHGEIPAHEIIFEWEEA